MSKNLFLVDTPIVGDHRVLNAINRIQSPEVVDCSKFDYSSNPPLNINTINLLLRAFLISPYYWVYFYRTYKLTPKSILKGLKTSIKTHHKALKIFYDLKQKYKNNHIEAIYANDLMCGIVGMYLAHYFNVPLIYDAHEIEFHRNRKNSYLRVVFDLYIEQKVIEQASSVIVVNEPIAKLYQQIYNIPREKIDIVSNNHFEPYFNYALDAYQEQNNQIAIVYVGGGINGRKLEKLAEDNSSMRIPLYGFFLSNIPNNVLENGWIVGDKEYLPELMELIKYKKCVMWCCVDDICLSYRLALPNKFFQAIALGMPIIAYKGTYLADIVIEYELGYVYDNSNLKEIVDNMEMNENYYKYLNSVSEFQNKLFKQRLAL